MKKNVLFLSHSLNPVNALKFAGVHSGARALGWTVQSAEFGWTGWGVAEIVAALKPDGVILDGGRLSGRLDQRPLRGLPCVYLDTDFPAPPGKVAVCSDAEAIADLAADELLASAPARAAFFSVIPKKAWSRRRCARFRERMRAANIPFSAMTRVGDIARLGKPLAVFAANDMSAAALFRGATTLGLKCPEDFTLVSVDNDLLFCEGSSPKVTSIEQDSAGVGAAAIMAMKGLFSGRANLHAEILVPPLRIVRRSSSFRPQGHLTIAQKAEACIDARAADGLTIGDVAHAIGCSRRTAETYYRAAYGLSMGEAILARRFREAERLLANPRLEIGVIASMCGWKSPAHLARAFRARYGTTMTVWRRKEMEKRQGM